MTCFLAYVVAFHGQLIERETKIWQMGARALLQDVSSPQIFRRNGGFLGLGARQRAWALRLKRVDRALLREKLLRDRICLLLYDSKRASNIWTSPS